MANTRIADIIDPEVLADQISAKFPDMLVLGNSDLVEVDSTFPLGSPGTKFKIPFWKRVATFSDMSEGTALTTNKIATGSEHATVVRGGAAFEVLDTAQLVSKADPVGEVAGQISRRAAEYIDAKLVAQLELTPNTFDQIATQVDSKTTVTPNALVQAIINSLGDNFTALVSGGVLVMHSKVYGDLLQLDAIQFQERSGMDVLRSGRIPTLLGMPIWISDRCSVSSSGGNVYQTYIVGRGALALFYQRQVMVEFDRDILLKSDIISADVHFAPHLFGYDDVTTAVVAEDNKSIHVVNLRSR